MDSQTEEILEQEIAKGIRAEKAYRLYVKDFIAHSKESIHEAFDTLKIDDLEGLQKLKLMQSSITALEVSIKNDMASKKMAEAQLSNKAD